MVTLKIRSRSPKFNELFIDIGQNPLFGLRDNVWKPYFVRNLTFQSTGVTLKKGQGHQNLIFS